MVSRYTPLKGPVAPVERQLPGMSSYVKLPLKGRRQQMSCLYGGERSWSECSLISGDLTCALRPVNFKQGKLKGQHGEGQRTKSLQEEIFL